jgi:hypothetical protein
MEMNSTMAAIVAIMDKGCSWFTMIGFFLQCHTTYDRTFGFVSVMQGVMLMHGNEKFMAPPL